MRSLRWRLLSLGGCLGVNQCQPISNNPQDHRECLEHMLPGTSSFRLAKMLNDLILFGMEGIMNLVAPLI